ncbi:SAM-dependent methyltransferase [Paenibacillus sp. J31TS4]|nr:SAM-dependent methyltransferase [Paenibacillus sp. J31TS4]
MARTGTTEELSAWIRARIEESGERAVPFVKFMEWCLYHPDSGYYMRKNPKVGKDGDFYTSSAIGDVMGRMTARELARLADRFGWGDWDLLEWGGGTGRFAAQVLDALEEERPDLYRGVRFRSVDNSPFHRQLQKETLERHAARVIPADETGWARLARPDRTIILSNELLDAFPVHRVTARGGELMELWVAWDEDAGGFRWEERPCFSPKLLSYMRRHGIRLRDRQTAELNLQAEAWLRERAQWLEAGAIVTIDYGDTSEELYAGHRMNGTLLAYRRHQATDRPLDWPGDQDITAHVDFSVCMEAGREGGMTDQSLRTQKQFLIDNGILELLADHAGTDPFSPEARRNRAVRQLLVSDQMSELFKVLVQTKTRGTAGPPDGS